MATKGDIDRAIYQFKKDFSNNQNFDITVDRDYILIERQYIKDRQIDDKQKTIQGVLKDE